MTIDEPEYANLHTRREFLGHARTVVGASLALGLVPKLGMAAAEIQSARDTLHVAVTGGNGDSLDPHRTEGQISDAIRCANLYDGLSEYQPDASVQLSLAESFTPNANADRWTLKLRPGIKLHDGRDFVADDVIYTIKRILDKDHPTKGVSLISFIDPAKISKTDDLTLVFDLPEPYGPFPNVWANSYLRMVPRDFDPAKPVGTGPFKYVSFTPGRESVFERFDDYFREPAKIKTLVMPNISDPSASMNALRGKQVDLTYKVAFSEARIIADDPDLAVLNNPATTSLPLYMRTDVEPFNDPRVRKAFRLIPNRKQMVKVALAGYGAVGNDIQAYSIAPCGPTAVAQREQDIKAAKALLKEAGKEDLVVDLMTVNGTAGMVECAQVFAEQAKLAGVTVNVRVLEEPAYLANYGNWIFGVDFLGDEYLQVAANSLIPGGAFNMSHWNDERFTELYRKAISTSDAATRCSLINQMQAVEYEEGGNILWGFANTLNAYSKKVQGLVPYTIDSPFYHLRKLWISE